MGSFWDDRSQRLILFDLATATAKYRRETVMSELLISIKIEPLEEGGYLATSNEFPDLLAHGRTVAETMEIAQDVARKLVESYIEHGDPLPEALSKDRVDDAVVEAKVPVSIAI